MAGLVIGFPVWGRSSAGRAPALQAGGHRFDPGRLHPPRLLCKRVLPHRLWLSQPTRCRSPKQGGTHQNKHWLYRGMFRIRFDHVLRQSVLGRVVTPFVCLPCLCWVVAVVLLKCESGSGASLGACDRRHSFGVSVIPLFSRLV
jgi:hypothetical protein